jgi:hypothetical protein
LFEIQLDVDDLLRWAKRIGEEQPARTLANIAMALNQFGSGVKRELVENISSRSGIAPGQVASLLIETPATEKNTFWELDANPLLQAEGIYRGGELRLPMRHWETPRPRVFYEGTLVQVMTMGDEKVCEICSRLEEEGPYTVEELKIKAPQADFVGGHLNAHGSTCRCQISSFFSRRRLDTTVRTLRRGELFETHRYTQKSLASFLSSTIGWRLVV